MNKTICGLFLFSVTLALLYCNRPTPAASPDRPPNLIFLLTDDQRADALGAAGNSIIQTPHLDKLASDGYHFTNAYVTTSICMVSRASILTGQYAARHGINGFHTSLDSNQLANSYPVMLRANGYRTGFIGKYGVGDPKDQPRESFDYWAGAPLHQPHYENIDSLGNYLHYTDLVNGEIEQFLAGIDNRPFSLSVSFKAPHSEDGDPRQFIPHPRYDSLYQGVDIPLPATASEASLGRLPAALRDEQNLARKRWHLRFDTPERYQQNVKNYYRLITGVDDVVGNLRRRLAELEIADNTVIIFMGDNGFYLGEHGLAGKWFGHEESIRVPLVIYDPRPASLTSNVPPDTLRGPSALGHEVLRSIKKPKSIALNIDVAPTLLALAGIDRPAGMQGIDLRQLIADPDYSRKQFFYEHNFLGSPKLPKTEGLVSRERKYLVYPESGAEELYDLLQDPGETTNLADDPDAAEEMATTREAYRRLKTQVSNALNQQPPTH